MEDLDRFAVLREALAQDRWSDVEINLLAERSCELHLVGGQVLVLEGQPTVEWFVVVEGRIMVSEHSGRRWVAEGGSVLRPDEEGRWAVTATVLDHSAVLAITSDSTAT